MRPVPPPHTALIALALAAVAACSGEAPTQPTRPTDCVYFSLTAPRTLNAGQTVALGAFRESCRPMFFPLDPNQIAWQSLDPAVASVNAASVTGVRQGVAVIQGTYGDMSSQAIVVVDGPQPGPAVSVRLRMVGSPTMSVQQSAGFSVVEEFSNASYAFVSDTATWHSSDRAVADIVERAGTGVVIHAWRSGSTTISAINNGRRVAITVRAPAR